MTDSAEQRKGQWGYKEDREMLNENSVLAAEVSRLWGIVLKETDRVQDAWRKQAELEEKLVSANLSRDSWKREAELNEQAANECATYSSRLATALEALRTHGIHVEEPWCWCDPIQDSENHWIHTRFRAERWLRKST